MNHSTYNIKILIFLNSRTVPVTVTEIAKATKIPLRKVQIKICSLKGEKMISHPETKFWEITQDGRESLKELKKFWNMRNYESRYL